MRRWSHDFTWNLAHFMFESEISNAKQDEVIALSTESMI